MTSNHTHVVVVGGGYAGTVAANHLFKRPDLEVTLVNERPKFVERIRLHQMVAGTSSATADFSALLNPRIQLIVDNAMHIDTSARHVKLLSGAELQYDYLIYAVGSTAAAPAVLGAEFAFRVGEFEHAERLKARMADLDSDAPVSVVGGGLTGIETAAELARDRAEVKLICGPRLGPSLGDPARRSVARQLAKLGVTVVEGPLVTSLSADSVVLSDGCELPSAATVWTAGFGVPALAARSGLMTDEVGRLLTDETLTSVDDRHVVAAGDAAAPSNSPLRMGCQAALPLGVRAADTVLSRLDGDEPAVVNQAFVAQCISLGRSRGTIQITHTDDRPRRLYVGGRAAAMIKESICRATVKTIAKEAAKPGAFFWPRGNYRQAPAMTPSDDPRG